MTMSLLTLPTEIRLHVYSFLFPSPKSHIILVPYNPSNPDCQFEIPLSLYGTCKTIRNELPSLRERLRSLDLLYIVHFYMRDGEEAPTQDEESAQAKNFERMTRFAESIRIVGWDRAMEKSWREQPLIPSLTHCVVRTIEVQPLTISAKTMWIVMMQGLTPLIRHVLERLELRLIREGYHPKYRSEMGEEEKVRDLDQLEEIFGKWMEMEKHGKQYWCWRPLEAYGGYRDTY